MTTLVPAAMTAFFALGVIPARAEAVWPLPGTPIRIMNTVSTLQFYGPTPGFHHGLDLAAPPGTLVVAPISGRVETGHYYKRQSDYTYEVAITTDDGIRWEFHHIDPDEIPPRIETLAADGGRVAAGEVLGGIYDAAEIGIEPHVHINLIGADGFYRDPLGLLPDAGDRTPPVLNEWWTARVEGERLVEVAPADAEASMLVLDVYDLAPGGLGPQSVQSAVVSRDGETLFAFDLATLPEPSFLEGVDEVYFLGDLQLSDGAILRSDAADVRRFLHAVPLGEERGAVKVVLGDASGNLAEHTLRTSED